jgi:hypothetical protein
VKVHARLAPGIVAPGNEVSVRIHLPRKLAGVTLKLWELDGYVDRDGAAKREPAGDLLLAQWDGDLEAGDGATPNDVNYVKFSKHQETLTTPDTDTEDAFRLRVRLPGDDEAIQVPMGSEKTQLVARGVSLALSIENGGSELFRTTSSCVAQMPTTTILVGHHRFSMRNEAADFYSDVDDDRIEEVHAHQWITLGVQTGTGMTARLDVLGSGYLDATGLALDSDKPTAQPLVVRKGRKLFVYIHERKLDLPKGASKIPIAACDMVEDDGTVSAERPEQGDRLELRIAEVPIEFGERATFKTDLSATGQEMPANEDHVTAWAEAARRFQKVT